MTRKWMTMLTTVVVIAGVLSSCASTHDGMVVRDDVYYAPGTEPIATTGSAPAEAPPPPAATTDDYFSPEEATAPMPGSSGYYDVTYNDPYYYNYDRFGFDPTWNMNAGMSTMPYGPGSSWSFGLGFTYGMGYPYGPYLGMGTTWGMGWPYSPWSWNVGWGMGWGYGPYYGPWGACMTCYCPVVVGAGSGAYYGPRPGLGGGNTRPLKAAAGLTPRDPVGLARPVLVRQPRTGTGEQRPISSGTLSRPITGSSSGTRGGTDQERPARNTQVRTGTNDRSSSPSRNGGYERGNGSRSTPSPGGGGVRPTTVPGRPR